MVEKDIDTSRLEEAMAIPGTGALGGVIGMRAFCKLFFPEAMNKSNNNQTNTGAKTMGTEETIIIAWAKNFKNTVEKMRNAQKMYFKTRDIQWLNMSKQFERKVDESLKNSPFSADIPADN